jgi:diguanylate cyclase (GGDEF)-like protein
MKILIVEDVATDRLMLRSAVQHLGHECLVASSGAEGWELFGLHQPDVVISDWQMPGVDGMELCRRIRAGEWSTYTPFIFVTGLTDREHALAGMEVGADDFLTKPLDIHDLRARLMAAGRLKRSEGRVIERTAALEVAIRDLETEVAERVRAETALKQSEERFRKQYKSFPLPTYSWLRSGEDFVLQDYNDAAGACSQGIIDGSLASARFVDEPQIMADLKDCAAAETTIHREVHARNQRTGLMQDLAVTYVFVPPQTVMIHTEDKTEVKRAEQVLRQLALHDALTGLPNRVLFTDRLNHALLAATRRAKVVAVLFLDLDDFKTINDRLGHEQGDALLVEVARRLVGCIRPADTASRLGGDEFTVLLEDLASENDATAVAERIALAVRAPVLLAGGEVIVNVSIGAAFSDARGDAKSLLREADLAMYRAKAKGRRAAA